jgi:PncC family amidohydrolase
MRLLMAVPKSLAAQVVAKLLREGWTLSVAESCTGGLFSDAITDIDGSSKVFLGGIVAYSPQAKIKLCSANEATISTYGTISSQITAEIAEGVKKQLSAMVTVGITGIAGDTLEGKPEGLVYIYISSPNGNIIEELQFEGSRRQIKERAVQSTLKLLLRL